MCNTCNSGINKTAARAALPPVDMVDVTHKAGTGAVTLPVSIAVIVGYRSFVVGGQTQLPKILYDWLKSDPRYSGCYDAKKTETKKAATNV